MFWSVKYEKLEENIYSRNLENLYFVLLIRWFHGTLSWWQFQTHYNILLRHQQWSLETITCDDKSLTQIIFTLIDSLLDWFFVFEIMLSTMLAMNFTSCCVVITDPLLTIWLKFLEASTTDVQFFVIVLEQILS